MFAEHQPSDVLDKRRRALNLLSGRQHSNSERLKAENDRTINQNMFHNN